MGVYSRNPTLNLFFNRVSLEKMETQAQEDQRDQRYVNYHSYREGRDETGSE